MSQSHSIRGFVSGRVQGVGFRYFVMRVAQSEDLHGYVRNLSDGRVEFLLQGETSSVDRAVERIRVGPNHAQVRGIQLDDVKEPPDCDQFVILR